MDLSFLVLSLPDKRKIQSLIDSKALTPSTYNSAHQLDLRVRNSLYAPYDLLANVHETQIGALMEMIEDATGLQDISLLHGQVLCYEVGGHFQKHRDTQIDARHRGTVLIFPPTSECSFEGGKLICTAEPSTDNVESVQQAVKTHRTHQWNLIYLPLGTDHCVQPVTSGKRIVFKYALFASNECNRRNKLLPLEPPTTTSSSLSLLAASQVCKTLAQDDVEDGFCDFDARDEYGSSLFD